MQAPDLPAVLIPITHQLRAYFQQTYPDRLDRLVLFGSWARGEATGDSDLDLLVVLRDPVSPSREISQTSEFIGQLCLDHNILISRLFMGRSRFETENSPLLRNIRREGIAL